MRASSASSLRPTDSQPSHWSRNAAGGIGVLVTALAAAVLAGWYFDIPVLVKPAPTAVPIAVEAALAFAACGISVMALAAKRNGWAFGAGAVAALVGLVSGFERLAGIDLGIAAVLSGSVAASGEAIRMSGFAAGLFVLIGGTMMAASARPAPQTAFILVALPGIALLGLELVVLLAAVADVGPSSPWRVIVHKALNLSFGMSFVAAALVLHGWTVGALARDVRPHWTAWLAGGAVAALAVLVSQTLIQREALNREAVLRADMSDLKERTVDRIVSNIPGLMPLKGVWERQNGMPRPQWEGMSRGLMGQNPSFAAMLRIDREFRIAWSTGDVVGVPPDDLARAVAGVRDLVPDVTKLRGELFLTAPTGTSGDPGSIVLMAGFTTDGRFAGFMGVVLRYATLFDELIEGRADAGIGVQIEQNGVVVGRTPGFAPPGSPEHEIAIDYPLFEQSFRVAVGDLVPFGGQSLLLPQIVLVSGLLIAVLLIVVIGSARRARLELAESEKQYRETFENAPVPMCWVGLDGRFIRTNRTFRELLGYTSEELSRMGPSEVVHASMQSKAEQAVRRLFAGEEERYDSDFRCLRKDGQTVWVHVSAAAMRRQDGSPLFLLTHLQDITARKVAEEQLFQSQKMEALGNLAGGIAHDFNNMLLPIVALTEISRDELPEESPARENLGSVLEAASQASALVQQILTFSRQNERQLEEIDISRCIADALHLLRNVVPSSLTMQPEIEARIGIVTADRAQLHSVIMNLGSNAVDAMGGKAGHLTVSLRRTVISGALAQRLPALVEGAAYAKLTVMDTGRGMEKATLEKIFHPFFTTKAVGEGTGLGLAMVHGIVESLGGVIDVESAVGHGTTFNLYIPLSGELEADDPDDLELTADMATSETVTS